MEDRICPRCGITFRAYRSNPQVHCSRACQSASTRRTTTCPQCGTEFWFHQSWPRTYCSLKCSGLANVKYARYTATCEQCGASFTRVLSQPGRFCSQRCYGDWQSEHIRGDAHPAKGRPNARKGIWNSVTLMCPVCHRTFAVKASHAARRKFCSRLCAAADHAQSGRFSGPNSPTWRGGYQPYYGPSWRPAMRAARRRDVVCQRCGVNPRETGRALDVHHIVPFRRFGLERHREANALDNLRCYCVRCHLLMEPGRRHH